MVKTKTNSKIKKATKTNQPKAGRPRAEKSVKKPAKKPVKKTVAKKKVSAEKKIYFEAVGRRKTAIARVRLFTSSPSQSAMEGNLIINNDKKYKEFFPTLELQRIIEAPLGRLKSLSRFRATIKVKGGGTKGQAEAICHGLARALVLFDPNFRKKLKKVGYLTRDPRKKERKKYGLKKARRAPQWSKR